MARQGMGRGAATMAAGLAVLAAVTACSGGSAPRTQATASPGGREAGRPAAAAHDPAVTFAGHGAALPEAVTTDIEDSTTSTLIAPPVTLHGDLAWAATSQGLLALDAATGETRADLRPEGRSTEPSNSPRTDLKPPPVATVSGQALVVQTFAVTIPGQGTTKAHTALELVAADADTARQAWRQVIDLPDDFPEADGGSLRTAVMGIDGTTAVVRVKAASGYGSGDAGTVAIDLAARKVAWDAPKLDPAAMGAGQVVGVVSGPHSWSPKTLEARAAATGAQTWSKDTDNPSVVAVGPSLVLARGLKGMAFGAVDGIEIGSGRETPVQLPETAPAPPGYCVYDQRSVTVCVGSSLLGLDPGSGAVLWAVSNDPKRESPRLTGAWHGLVYGENRAGEPVALDARTGKDAETPPGAAPYWTDGRYAVTAKEIVAVTG
ncbi:hypothetical protein FNH05_26120 [Amycolatopsis rhizosphaerae]|uniref:PQQ-binding-like beta-propeller repeat protein n=1 Tax=Amycolatopsis rhizosphaerae TaxID=2053003 RepID=A0A558BFY9_9PSEU|nr:hypothetical protein [Amycolatopsis rhizosphaerae]TVT35419.1 hypothetical protein FNH05_26120 [Amycolatopsis rhizosphaerae]